MGTPGLGQHARNKPAPTLRFYHRDTMIAMLPQGKV